MFRMFGTFKKGRRKGLLRLKKLVRKEVKNGREEVCGRIDIREHRDR